jgi:hypothetical protein
MNRRSLRIAAASLLSVLALAVFAARVAPSVTPSASARTVTCELSNPGYSGWCRVSEKLSSQTTPASVCEGVLRCMNDVSCIKTYCNATTLRGGWKLEGIRTDWKKKKK